MNQRKRSKEGSRARTASGPGRWRFILYVCKTHRHCVTHTHAPRLQQFVIFRRFSVFLSLIFSFHVQYCSLLQFVFIFCLQLPSWQKAAKLRSYSFCRNKQNMFLLYFVLKKQFSFCSNMTSCFHFDFNFGFIQSQKSLFRNSV